MELRIPDESGRRNAAFFLALAGICLLALAVRAPGLRWLLDVAPYSGFDFHPDAMGLIRPAGNFAQAEHPSGYPLGMTTQLYLARKALELLGVVVDPTLLMRTISVGYGVLTVFLTGVLARTLTASAGVGLLAALFLALSPLHIINSHFGTADSTLVFFLYLSLVFGWRTLRGQRDLDFLLFVAAVGVTLAIKFFIPLLLPLGIVVWHQTRRVEKALEGALVLAGSFSAANFFNYTPWDLSRLFELIRYDNLTIVGGFSPPQQVARYSWETTSALGLAVWLFFVVGLGLVLARAWNARRTWWPLDAKGWYDLTREPLIVPASALTLHFASLIAAGYHAPRHLLPFVPLMCFVAAIGFVAATGAIRARASVPASRAIAGAALLLVVVYQGYQALGTEKRYTNDIRNALAGEISRVASPEDEVVSFSRYSLVRGARLASPAEAAESRPGSAYFVTCSMEYHRYVGAQSTSEVFHAYGGERRLGFFQDLFAGRSEYRLAFEVSWEDYTLEQRLQARGLLPPPGWFSPSHCALFARGDEVAQRGP